MGIQPYTCYWVVEEDENKDATKKEYTGANEGAVDVVGGSESDLDLIWQFKLDDSQFRTYVSPTNIHNINLSTEGGLEFLDLLHRTPGHAGSFLNVEELQVGMEYSSKDSFIAAVKWFSIKNIINYYVTKSCLEKFETNCAIHDGRCQ
ncbi:hypothetical protein J1N35_013600 [Gossypium stocksii]|uniref:Uncharacterized protein n=1 Tax=Gossypium stocksii TaxID=47602 RepID=A0A9D4A8I4_9ROSI|nr:hypothetical protein J1N35_013600 [Gossypium stocksii]